MEELDEIMRLIGFGFDYLPEATAQQKLAYFENWLKEQPGPDEFYDLQIENDELRSDVRGLEGDVDDLTYERDELQDKVKELEDQIKELDKTVNSLEDDIYSLQKELNEAGTR